MLSAGAWPHPVIVATQGHMVEVVLPRMYSPGLRGGKVTCPRPNNQPFSGLAPKTHPQTPEPNPRLLNVRRPSAPPHAAHPAQGSSAPYRLSLLPPLPSPSSCLSLSAGATPQPWGCLLSSPMGPTGARTTSLGEPPFLWRLKNSSIVIR